MKSDVTHGYSGCQGHSERLDGAIEVLVIDRVLVMPEASDWTGYFVANEGNAIDSWSWLDRVDRRPGPGVDRRLHSHRGPHGREAERGGATNSELTVGNIVVHVALAWISLAPDVFVGSDVLTFGEVSRTRIRRCVQVARCHRDPVGGPGVSVARVVVWRCRRVSPRVNAGKGIHPGA